MAQINSADGMSDVALRLVSSVVLGPKSAKVVLRDESAAEIHLRLAGEF